MNPEAQRENWEHSLIRNGCSEPRHVQEVEAPKIRPSLVAAAALSKVRNRTIRETDEAEERMTPRVREVRDALCHCGTPITRVQQHGASGLGDVQDVAVCPTRDGRQSHEAVLNRV